MSVVIPVRDDAPALAVCLRLLAEQTVPPFEVVVVDNGSSDDSARVAREYGARVVDEPLVGIAPAAATGYDAARGEVIARLDADSTPGPRWLERIGARMAADPQVEAVTGTGTFYGCPAWVAFLMRGLYLHAYYATTHAALGHTSLWGSNMALRSTTWAAVRTAVHRGDPEVHDDLDLAFALGPDRRVVYDSGLVVGVSARSLRGRRQLQRRMRRAFHTLAVNWRVEPPWERWQRRLGVLSDARPPR